ncbi:MAG: DinB family protein [Ignavibacteriales bacterium]|nr:MAG: DinB family protein [Ignavibacteriales bacterium]
MKYNFIKESIKHMKETAKNLIRIVEESNNVLNDISQEDWLKSSAPGKWTKKEILGHLIDSAANNHQRFIRVQYDDNRAITYDQDKWVAAEKFTNASTENLINLWQSYNKHLAHIISVFPKDKNKNLCNIGKEEPVTVEWLIKDYVRHLEHHLNQIISN